MNKKNIFIILILLCSIFISVMFLIRHLKNQSTSDTSSKNLNYLDEETKSNLVKKYGLNAPSTNKSSDTTHDIGHSFGKTSKNNNQAINVIIPEKIELISYKGIRVDEKEIFLNETSDTIKNTLEENPNIINHSNSKSFQYSYKYFDIFFDENGKCREIQIINYSEIPIYYDDHNLCDLKSYEDIESFFKKYDDKLIYDYYGFTSEKLGINIFCEHLDESPENPVDTFLIFRNE